MGDVHCFISYLKSNIKFDRSILTNDKLIYEWLCRYNRNVPCLDALHKRNMKRIKVLLNKELM